MPKLPADLPENWTQGQIVSPNGTETGLTEQHGYNYLMKQVNNTQTEVNNINDALPDVAQQVTVEEINNKIGEESDADTQPTLFGRLAQLKNVLLEKLAEVITKITGVDSKIGTSGDTAGTSTLFGQVKDISEKMPTGAVKSVQKGIITAVPNTGVSGKLYEIPINTVDPNKCLVVLNSGLLSNGSSLGGDSLILTDLSANILKVTVFTTNTGGSASFCWQVIEFF